MGNTLQVVGLGALTLVFTLDVAPAGNRDVMRTGANGVSFPFVENVGQTDPRVAYCAMTGAGTCFVTTDGQLVYSLPSRKMTLDRDPHIDAGVPSGWTLVETPLGGRPNVEPGEEADTRVAVFHGSDSARWHSRLRAIRDVSLGELWPGIRLALNAHGDNVEKIFTVEPGASADAIAMRIDGAECVYVGDSGRLIVQTGLGEVSLSRPVAYQEVRDERLPVPVEYRLIAHDAYGFAIGPYDPSQPVVIDPLIQATYLGGSSDETSFVAAVHPTNGDVYVAGNTDSPDFPGVTGGAQSVNAGGSGGDIFIVRLNPSLTEIKQATYVGGSSGERGYAMAIHPATGDVYVAGLTFSTNFPGTAGGLQPALAGADDAVVVRLDASLTSLVQATYLGGAGGDDAWTIGIHPINGEVYVGGETYASGFPGTSGGAQGSFGGAADAYVARLNPSLSSLTQATYLGGSSADYLSSLAINGSSGDVYICGHTQSTSFPGTPGGAQTLLGGASDAFVARLNSTLTSLTQSTYFGGSSNDFARAVALNPATSEVFIAGTSAGTDLPGTAGGAQAVSGGGRDGFLARFGGDLTSLNQATYFGGAGDDFADGLAARPGTGEVFIDGETGSSNLPGTTGGSQPAWGGATDAFAARFVPSLAALSQSTYLGGAGGEGGNALLLHPTLSEIYVVGYTDSVGFPGTGGGAQPHMDGTSDAFIARLGMDLRGGPSISSIKSKTSKPGSRAVIYGAGFSKTASLNKVYFGRKMAAIKKSTETTLKVTIPISLKKGKVNVHAEAEGVSSNVVSFTLR